MNFLCVYVRTCVCVHVCVYARVCVCSCVNLCVFSLHNKNKITTTIEALTSQWVMGRGL
jgi:hypothetical protein